MINKRINIYDKLFEMKDFYVKIDFNLIERIRGKIKEKSPSLKKYNEEKLKLKHNIFRTFFQKAKKTRKISRVRKFCRNLRIGKEEIYESVEGFYARGSKGVIVQLPRRLKINENFVEGYALYIGEGDFGSNGEKTPKKVRFTNSNLDVIKFFVDWLRNHFPKTDFSCRVLVPQGKELNQEKLEAVKKKLGVNKINTYTSKRNKKLVYRVWADSIILMKLLLDLEETVKEEALSSKKLAKAYIRGIMMGEGTARLKGYHRYVRVEMKNKKEINFVGELLNLLDIEYKPYSRSDGSGRYWIHIGERKDIEKFGKLVGFGVHSERQRILEECIDSYKEVHFRKGEAEQKFLEAVNKLTKEGKVATTLAVSELLDRSITNARHTLKSLYEKGHLKRTRNSKNYFEYEPTGRGLKTVTNVAEGGRNRRFKKFSV